MDNISIVLNGTTYYHYDQYMRQVNINVNLSARIKELEGIIANKGSETTRFYIHSEPTLFHYNHYSIDAIDEQDARKRFDEYLDSTVGDIYPTQSHVDTEKRNSNITNHPFGDSEYLHIE